MARAPDEGFVIEPGTDAATVLQAGFGTTIHPRAEAVNH
jgi:hypothetical protein